MRIKSQSLALLVALVTPFATAAPEDAEPAPKVAKEHRVIEWSGSDTMLQVGLAWMDSYRTARPAVRVNVDGSGSSVGIKDLIQGKADLAASSRPIKDSELAKFRAEHGFPPVEHIVGYDVVAIYVHPDNPAKTISMEQLKAIYGKGGAGSNWGDVVEGFDKDVVRIGRSRLSGTYAFFKKAVLGPGKDFGPGIATMNGSVAVVEFVASNAAAIGYSGLSYKTEQVRCLAITDADGEAVEPSLENIRTGRYPLRRPLYVYQGNVDNPEVIRFLQWLKSPAGQKIVADEGFISIK